MKTVTITFSGPVASGRTVLLNMVQATLERNGLPVKHTEEHTLEVHTFRRPIGSDEEETE